jgi:branched-chain amino acid transport system ATP-binding protein
LRAGALGERPGPWTLERVYDLFPMLREKRNASATALSGGQQQMCAIGRALMANPRLLLCDEISLGLAPAVVKQVYAALDQVCAGGQAVVLVEQDVELARSTTERIVCLLHGRVTLSGRSRELERETISQAYFGV